MPNGDTNGDENEKPPKPDPLEVTPAERTDEARALRERLKEENRRPRDDRS